MNNDVPYEFGWPHISPETKFWIIFHSVHQLINNGIFGMSAYDILCTSFHKIDLWYSHFRIYETHIYERKIPLVKLIEHKFVITNGKNIYFIKIENNSEGHFMYQYSENFHCPFPAYAEAHGKIAQKLSLVQMLKV